MSPPHKTETEKPKVFHRRFPTPVLSEQVPGCYLSRERSSYGYINSSLINLIAGDELYAFFPYNPQADLRGWYSQMMPTNSDSKVVTGFTDGNALGGLITDEGKVLYSPGYRIYYNLKCDKGTENYRADFATFFEKNSTSGTTLKRKYSITTHKITAV